MPAPVVAPIAPNAPSAVPVVATPQKPAEVAKPGAPAAPAEAEHLFEVKIDGQAQKMTRAQIERLASKSGYADKTIRQAKDALKAIAERKAELDARDSIWDDDEKLEAELLRRGKLDPLAKKRLQHHLQESEMTPDQKGRAEAESKLAEAQKKLDAAEAEKAQARLTESAKKRQAIMQDELFAAAERAGIPRDAEAFYAIYEAMKEARDLGLLNPKDFTAGDADRIVETAMENITATDKRREAAVLKGLKGKALVDRLGKSVVDEVLRYKLEVLRGGGEKKPPAPAPTNGAAKPGNGTMTLAEARAAISALGKTP